MNEQTTQSNANDTTFLDDVRAEYETLDAKIRRQDGKIKQNAAREDIERHRELATIIVNAPTPAPGSAPAPGSDEPSGSDDEPAANDDQVVFRGGPLDGQPVEPELARVGLSLDGATGFTSQSAEGTFHYEPAEDGQSWELTEGEGGPAADDQADACPKQTAEPVPVVPPCSAVDALKGLREQILVDPDYKREEHSGRMDLAIKSIDQAIAAIGNCDRVNAERKAREQKAASKQ